ncbi:hypothetical protein Hte_007187 [Hypoxylon texense]
MRRMAFLLLTVLHFSGLSSCAALASPTPPTALGSNEGQPSPIPTSPALGNLEARSRSGSLCGYYEGDAAKPFLCPDGKFCLHNDGFNAIGCVSSDTSESTYVGAVFTTCLNYNDYMNDLCADIGPRTGCCQNSYYPACIYNTYTGSDYEGYTMVWCAQDYTDRGALLAWDASTSGQSPTTMFVVIPNTNTNTNAPTETPASAQLPASTTTPSPTPTAPPQGLSTSDKITLGTALGIGLPATIAGIIAAWYTYKAWEKRKKGTLLKDDDQDTLVMGNSESNRSSKVSDQSQITMTLL